MLNEQQRQVKQCPIKQDIENDERIEAWKRKNRDDAVLAFLNSDHGRAMQMARFN